MAAAIVIADELGAVIGLPNDLSKSQKAAYSSHCNHQWQNRTTSEGKRLQAGLEGSEMT